jgi:hypothetical protein
MYSVGLPQKLENGLGCGVKVRRRVESLFVGCHASNLVNPMESLQVWVNSKPSQLRDGRIQVFAYMSLIARPEIFIAQLSLKFVFLFEKFFYSCR